jgi:hypothetical protein
MSNRIFRLVEFFPRFGMNRAGAFLHLNKEKIPCKEFLQVGSITDGVKDLVSADLTWS